MKHQLLMEAKDLPKRINSLFNEFSKNELSVKNFIENPTGNLVRNLIPEMSANISDRNISDGNKLIYSVLANKEFRNWLNEYQSEAKKEIDKKANSKKTINELFPRERVLEDLSKAIYEFGDKYILKSILKSADNSLTNAGTFVFVDDIAVVVAAVVALLVVLTAIDATPLVADSEIELLIDAQKLRAVSETMIEKAISESSSKNL